MMHQPIGFRGQTYAASKEALPGAARACSAEQTLARVEPLAARIGIKRICDLTGLDRIGVPVYCITRPSSYGQVHSWGKGITHPQAKVSAIMEGFERHHGEVCNIPHFTCPYDAISGAKIPLERLALKRYSTFRPDRAEAWCSGWDVMRQEECAAPYRSVVLGTYRHVGDFGSFIATSNGLAASNGIAEAVCSALFECVERDAVTCAHLINMQRNQPAGGKRVPLEDLPYPDSKGLVEQCLAADVLPIVFDCTLDIDVPTYLCYVYDLRHPEIGLYNGRGTHLDPDIALARAITEAVQGRLAFLCGSHDGVAPTVHQFARITPTQRFMNLLEQAPVANEMRASQATDSVHGDANVVMDKLRGAGLDQALVWDLTQPGIDVCVIKMIVPGLEGWNFSNYAPGARAKQFMERAKQ